MRKKLIYSHKFKYLKYGFHYTNFHRTQNYSTALYGNLLHQIPHKSAKKYRKYVWKFSGAHT